MSGQAQYTPGPWMALDILKSHKTCGYAIRNEVEIYGDWKKAFPVPPILGASGLYGPIPKEADARLIAAAPELLEALKKLRDGGSLICGDADFVDAVIARAEGREVQP